MKKSKSLLSLAVILFLLGGGGGTLMINGCSRGDGGDSGGTTDPDNPVPDPKKYRTDMEINWPDGPDNIKNVSDGLPASINIVLTKTDITSSENGEAEPIPGAKITLYVDKGGAKLNDKDGKTPLEVTTDEQGEVEVTFTADLGEKEAEVYNITVKYADVITKTLTARVSKDVVPEYLTFVSDAGTYVLNADGTSSLALTATIADGNGILLSGQNIKFTTSRGMLTTGSETTANGVAKTEIISARQSGVATVTATVQIPSGTPGVNNFISEIIKINFIGMTLVLHKNKESVRRLPPPTPPATTYDTANIVTVTAVLKDANSSPVYNAPVRFTIPASSSLEITEPKEEEKFRTNNAGELAVKLVGKTSDATKYSDIIIAQAAGVSCTLTINYSNDVIKIEPLPDANNNYTVSQRNAVDKNVTKMRISYRESSQPQVPVPNKKIWVSVSAGGMDFLSNSEVTTGTDGYKTIEIKNPEFSGDLQIKAVNRENKPIKIGDKDTIVEVVTDADTTIYIRAGKLYKLTLEATPEVIAVGGEIAQVIATAYDVAGNLVADERISFNIADAQGGSGNLSPFIATTGRDGRASVNFVSGLYESDQQGVRLIACSQDCSVRSDTVVITVANMIKNVSLSAGTYGGGSGGGAYTLPFTVIASDINNNPVPDNTPVVFSSRIVSVAHWRKVPKVSADRKTYSVGYDYTLRPVHDYNFNGIPDKGEPFTDNPFYLPRGELIIDGAQKDDKRKNFNPDSPFWDINANGIFDSAGKSNETVVQKYLELVTKKRDKTRQECQRDENGNLLYYGEDDKVNGAYPEGIEENDPKCKDITYTEEYEEWEEKEKTFSEGVFILDDRSGEWVEPWWTESEVAPAAPDYAGLSIMVWNGLPIVRKNSKGDVTAIVFPDEKLFYLDYNNNREFDWSEHWQTGADDKAKEKVKYTDSYGQEKHYFDIDWNGNGEPDPTSTRGVAIPKTVTISGGRGVATNVLTYGQTDAGYLGIEVWAEVKGVKSNVLRFEPLHIDVFNEDVLRNRKQNLDKR